MFEMNIQKLHVIFVCIFVCYTTFVDKISFVDAAEEKSFVIQKNYNDGTPTRIELSEQIFRSAAAGDGPVPAISDHDLANGIKPVVLAGKFHSMSGGVEKLTDGKGASTHDDPPNCFFFNTAVPVGRFRISLPVPEPISEINLYSWHRNKLDGPTRAPIKVRVYASRGSAEGFEMDDVTSKGYSLIATIDSTRPGGLDAQAGQHGVRICQKDEKLLGTFQHFIFEVLPPVDGLSHTFLTEIDIVRGEEQIAPRKLTDAGKYFDSHVAPLLARRCLECHNATDNKGGLDLSCVESVRKGADSGPVFLAGKPDESYLYNRVQDNEMPPKHPLSFAEKEIFKKWIADGAEWGTSPIDRFKISTESRAGYDWWSLQPVVRPSPPKVKQSDWSRNEIDQFVLSALEAKNLAPTQSADKKALIRRASIDLIGLPPTPEEVAAFEKDNSPDAYAKLVDRLLASPHYGERWGRHWLDVVRFAESQGFERNKYYYSAWKYRDWVIQAFNDDLPYNEFVRRQLAGDVIAPNDPQSIIATRYLVCAPYDELGSTFGSQGMRASVHEEELENVNGNIAQTFLALTVNCARCHDHKFDPIEQKDYFNLNASIGGIHRHDRVFEKDEKPEDFGENADVASALEQMSPDLKKQWQEALATAITEGKKSKKHVSDALEKAIKKKKNGGLDEPLRQEMRRELMGIEDNLFAMQRPQTTAALDVIFETLTAEQRAKWYPQLLKFSQAEMRSRLNSSGVVYSFDSQPPQFFYVLARGNYNSPGQLAKPHGIKCVKGVSDDLKLDPSAPEGERRLQLANWIADAKNPLTARTIVNRIWHYHFGVGIVNTPNDFGFNGGRPSNQELLDWLATEFVDHGWSVKHLHRKIMLSAAYQQATKPNPQATGVDADNRFLWRKSPSRMDAETLRDSVLLICGQLNPRMGGPSYDDAKFIISSNTSYLEKAGFNSSVNRRTIYRTLVRSTTSPFLETLDCANPSVSTPRRSVTTTPLQALSLLNNAFMEKASESFADRLVKEVGADISKQVSRSYELSLGRAPTDQELSRDLKFVEKFGLADLCLLLFNCNEFMTIQ